jgi:hypothetical protein
VHYSLLMVDSHVEALVKEERRSKEIRAMVLLQCSFGDELQNMFFVVSYPLPSIVINIMGYIWMV